MAPPESSRSSQVLTPPLNWWYNTWMRVREGLNKLIMLVEFFAKRGAPPSRKLTDFSLTLFLSCFFFVYNDLYFVNWILYDMGTSLEWEDGFCILVGFQECRGFILMALLSCMFQSILNILLLWRFLMRKINWMRGAPLSPIRENSSKIIIFFNPSLSGRRKWYILLRNGGKMYFKT